jgi:hypothetical protein
MGFGDGALDTGRWLIGLGEGPRDLDRLSCFCISARFKAAASGAAYAWNGFRKAFDFAAFGGCGLNGFGLGDLSGIGLEARLAGRKLSSRTWTKFEGNTPSMRLSRHNLPVHHDPSPAFRHSIKSPSTKPRSRFDYITSVRIGLDCQHAALPTSPPHEYVALHQHGNLVGNAEGAGTMAVE